MRELPEDMLDWRPQEPLVTRTPVTIRDPACVRKTFPDYFDVFRRLVRPG